MDAKLVVWEKNTQRKMPQVVWLASSPGLRGMTDKQAKESIDKILGGSIHIVRKMTSRPDALIYLGEGKADFEPLEEMMLGKYALKLRRWEDRNPRYAKKPKTECGVPDDGMWIGGPPKSILAPNIVNLKAQKGKAVSLLQKVLPFASHPYAAQLEAKRVFLRTCLKRLTRSTFEAYGDAELPAPEWCQVPGFHGCPVAPTLAPPVGGRVGYRNKCEFTIGVATDPSRQIEVGLVQNVIGGEPRVGPPSGCLHIPHAMQEAAFALRKKIVESSIPVYSRASRTGVWRILIVRQSVDGVMLAVQIFGGAPPPLQTAALDLLKSHFGDGVFFDGIPVVSLYMQKRDAPSDATDSDPFTHIWGAPHLEMNVLKMRFLVSPASFFQTNTPACTTLYSQIAEQVRQACDLGGVAGREGLTVLDVCCGTGSIGLCLAKEMPHIRVVGVEMVERAIQNAIQNAEANAMSERVSFVLGKAEDVLASVLKTVTGPVIAVVDPPRAGLHPSVSRLLRSTAAISSVVYVSCNFDSLVLDSQLLCGVESSLPFRPICAVPVDMFPHTLHCEAVVLLTRSDGTASS